MKTRAVFSRSLLASATLVVAIFASCAGEAPIRYDLGTGQETTWPYYDQGGTVYYDQGSYYTDTTVDQYVWPSDTTTDTWPQQQDTYAGSPFGCQADSDCFGMVCCPTPWGVKLCTDKCN